MIADKDGYVLLCQHTNRRTVRVAKDLTMTRYLEKFEGKRFNSPNDLVYRSDGTLYFTDPPYGLLKQDDDPAKELKFNGVFRYANGKLTAERFSTWRTPILKNESGCVTRLLPMEASRTASYSPT